MTRVDNPPHDAEDWDVLLDARLDYLESLASPSMRLRAQDFGLGDGSTPDATAIAAAFAAAGSAYTQASLDRGSVGIALEFPAGTWVLPATGLPLLAPSGSGRGSIHLIGQGDGITDFTCADRGGGNGCVGSKKTITSATRGTSGVAGIPGANTITLNFATAHGQSPAGWIKLYLASRGILRPMHFSITEVPTSTSLRFAIGTATTDAFFPQTGNLDDAIPTSGNSDMICYFLGVGFEPLNFKNPCELFIEGMSFTGGSSTGTPLDGIAFRRSSRMHIGQDVRVGGWWAGEIICGNAHGGQGAQNTDHSWGHWTSDNNVYCDSLLLDNSQAAWIDALTGPSGGVGGGRDYHYENIDSSAPGLYHIVIADGGSLQTGGLQDANFKNGYAPIRREGIAGITPCDPNAIDRIHGAFKIEAPGNWGFIDDESGMSRVWKIENCTIEHEAAIAINGTGNPTDFTDKPYTLSAVSCTAQIVTATIAAPFGSHMFERGDDIQMVINGGGAALSGEGTIASVSGNTLTISVPQYGGSDLAGPYTGTLGQIGFARCGILDAFEYTWLPDIVGTDKTCQGLMFSDIGTLRPGTIRLTLDDSAGKQRFLPQFRVRDVQVHTGTDLHTTSGSKLVTSASRRFRASDVGKTLVCNTFVAGGTAGDLIASYQSPSQVTMTSNAVGTTTTGAWLLQPKQVDAFRVKIERGTTTYEVFVHDSADPNAIAAGGLVEQHTDPYGNLAIRASVCSALHEFVGVAQMPSPASATDIVTTTATPVRALYNSPVIVVMLPGSTVTLGDDAVQLIADGAIAADSQIVDNGATNPGHIAQVAVTTGVPDAGQRIVGQVGKAAGAGVAGARLKDRWT